jgi:predicted permease
MPDSVSILRQRCRILAGRRLKRNAEHGLRRTSADGCHFLARLRGRLATRFWVKGCLDPESDGAAIRGAVGAFCRNSYDVARGTWSGRPARHHPVRRHHWLLLCGISDLSFHFSHASEHQRASRIDGFSASGAFRRSSRPRRSARKAQRNSDRSSQSRHQPDGRANHNSASFIGFDREKPTDKHSRPGGTDSSSTPKSYVSVFTGKLAETVKEPIVWAPILAFIIVLSGLRIPQLIVHSLSLLGHASGGVALFACGIVLASGKITVNRKVLLFVFLKNIMQPALVLGGLRWIGYGNPVVSEAVLTTAIPTMPIVIMFALQYRIAQDEAASSVFLSIMGSLVTMGIFIALTH